MTDYCSNRLISEAYRRMCEWTNPDGTIDDRSKYHDACHALGATIMNLVGLFMSKPFHYQYQGACLDDIPTFEVGYDTHSDTVYGTDRVGIMTTAVVDKKGDHHRRFFTLSHQDIDMLLYRNLVYIRNKMGEYIESHNLAEISGNAVMLKPSRVVIPIDIFDVGTLGEHFDIEGASLTLKFRLACDRHRFKTIISDGRYTISDEKPNFTDSKTATVIRNNQTDISDDEILKAVNDAIRSNRDEPDIDYDFGEDDGVIRYSMFVTVNDEDVEVSWYVDTNEKSADGDDGDDVVGYRDGGHQDKSYYGSVDWSVIDDARYI